MKPNCARAHVAQAEDRAGRAKREVEEGRGHEKASDKRCRGKRETGKAGAGRGGGREGRGQGEVGQGGRRGKRLENTALGKRALALALALACTHSLSLVFFFLRLSAPFPTMAFVSPSSRRFCIPSLASRVSVSLTPSPSELISLPRLFSALAFALTSPSHARAQSVTDFTCMRWSGECPMISTFSRMSSCL